MSNKHTPGPWHTERANGRYEIWPQDKGQTHTYVAVVPTSADAELIAAAPDLLEALARLLRADEQPPSEDQAREAVDAMAMARAAIAKATKGIAHLHQVGYS